MRRFAGHQQHPILHSPCICGNARGSLGSDAAITVDDRQEQICRLRSSTSLCIYSNIPGTHSKYILQVYNYSVGRPMWWIRRPIRVQRLKWAWDETWKCARICLDSIYAEALWNYPYSQPKSWSSLRKFQHILLLPFTPLSSSHHGLIKCIRLQSFFEFTHRSLYPRDSKI